MKFENAIQPTADQARATLKSTSREPVIMINLLKFKPVAIYPNGEQTTGKIAYGRYAAGFEKLLAPRGGRMIYSGTVERLMIGQCEDLWDAVLIVEYPVAQDFSEILRTDAYREISVHREAGLAGQLNIETSRWKI
jgi:uncharacterized protein (DUF1330 family)